MRGQRLRHGFGTPLFLPNDSNHGPYFLGVYAILCTIHQGKPAHHTLPTPYTRTPQRTSSRTTTQCIPDGHADSIAAPQHTYNLLCYYWGSPHCVCVCVCLRIGSTYCPAVLDGGRGPPVTPPKKKKSYGDRRRMAVRYNINLYALPVVLWVATYALGRTYPSLCRQLSLRFVYIPSIPTLRTAAAASQDATGPTLWYPVAYVRFVGKLLRYYWNIALLEATHMGTTAVLRTDGGTDVGAFRRPLWHHALSTLTSVFVHSNYRSLLVSIVRYICCLAPQTPRARGGNGAASLLGGLVGCALLNAAMLLSKRGLAARGAFTREHHPFFGSAKVQVLLRVVVYPFVSYVLGGRRCTTDLTSSTSMTTDQGASTMTASAGAGDGYTLSDASAHNTNLLAPPFAYLNGGESVCYAIAGFNYAYYNTHTIPLSQFILGYVSDELSNLFYVELFAQSERSHRFAVADVSGHSGLPTGAVSINPNYNPHFGNTGDVAATTGDIFFSASSSSEMHLTALAALLSGMGVGTAARKAPLMLPYARRVPLVGRIVRFVWPNPPPPISIPVGLLEATSAGSGVVVRLCRRKKRITTPSLMQPQEEDSASVIVTSPSVDSPYEYVVVTTALRDDEAAAMEALQTSCEAPGAATAVATSRAPFPSPTRQDKFEAAAVQPPGTNCYAPIDILVPADCFCPITRSLMSDPVRTDDGFTYDRDAITMWLESHDTSPMTNLSLRSASLERNGEVYTKLLRITEAYRAFCV